MIHTVSKTLKRAAGVTAAVLIFLAAAGALNHMYYIRTDGSDWTRMLWHYFYENKGKIDRIYLGSSHVYVDLNTVRLNELNGENNFNLASPVQPLNASYYLLKEAMRHNTLSHVYLELYHYCSTKDILSLDADPVLSYNRNWINIDYMKTSCNRLEYMLSVTTADRYVYTFFPFTRYRYNTGHWDVIRQTMDSKNDSAFLAYQYGDGYDLYLESGYRYSRNVMGKEARLLQQTTILDKDPIGEKSERYLRKIILHCQKKGIPITLFVSPMNELQLISTENYDHYLEQVRRIAGEYDVPFYDFNLAKEDYLPIHDDAYFSDSGHLNGKGASVFTDFFYDTVSGGQRETESYFYSSYAEKLEFLQPAVYGLYYIDSGQERIYQIASNKEGGMEYRIVLRPERGDSGGVLKHMKYRVLRKTGNLFYLRSRMEPV